MKGIYFVDKSKQFGDLTSFSLFYIVILEMEELL